MSQQPELEQLNDQLERNCTDERGGLRPIFFKKVNDQFDSNCTNQRGTPSPIFLQTVNAGQKDAEDDLFNELCDCFANLKIPWCEIRTRPSKLKAKVRHHQQPATKQRFVERKKEEEIDVVAKSKWRSRRSRR